VQEVNVGTNMFFEWVCNQKNIFMIFIVVSVLFISYLHYSTIPQIHDLHNIFAELYYIPLMIGALVFGLRGAVITFMFVSALYIPHIIVNWTGTYIFVANQLLHAITSGLFAFLAGFLIDREKKNKERAEKDRYLAGLGQAAAAIVHDLKSPLISIHGFARRLNQGKGDIATATDIIIRSAENMQLIVHDVLDFAKPVRTDIKSDDVCNIVRRTCELCREKADKKGVLLSANLPSESLNIPVDGYHMERALINILNNAIDASKPGGTVTITLQVGEDDVKLIIRDAGEGMDQETLKNIFIPFYTTKKKSGTGLGLAIAKKIIEGHEGRIHIESQISLGTEITVSLPQKISHIEETVITTGKQ
jgi:signal transduction histidine kinase